MVRLLQQSKGSRSSTSQSMGQQAKAHVQVSATSLDFCCND